MTAAAASRSWQVRNANCLTEMPKLDPDSIDVVITDPPYGIGITSKSWDRPKRLDPTRPPGRRRTGTPPNMAFHSFCLAWTRECLRVLKPGAHVAAFAAPRTAHVLASAIEQAGYEIRDTLMWLQSQGYPASRQLPGGRGTGLKPAYEPILLARRPPDGTLDETLARYGTGALHIDACRITDPRERCPAQGRTRRQAGTANPDGRWPANLLLSHHPACTSARCQPDCPVGLLGERQRFFYAAKPNRRQREAGCEHLPRRTVETFKIGAEEERQAQANPVANTHPTVKPIELMAWLVRLLTPPGGLVLDPFTGSGSTGAGAVLEGARFLGIEQEAGYVPIARARIAHWARHARRAAEAQPSSAPKAPRQARKAGENGSLPAPVGASVRGRSSGRAAIRRPRPDTGGSSSHANPKYRDQSRGCPAPRASR